MVRTERPYVFREGAAFNFEAGATPQLVKLCRRARWVTQWNTPRISEAATVKTDPIIASP